MSKAPTMPMYWDAYIADTTHLTLEQHGAYLMLLGAMWRREGYLPNNDKLIARMLGCTPAKWRKLKADLADLLTIEPERITQKKLIEIWQKTEQKITKNRANAKRGGRPKSSQKYTAKSNEINDLAKPNGFDSVKPNKTERGDIPDPDPSNPPNGGSKRARAKPPPSNADFDLFWEAYGKVGSRQQALQKWNAAIKGGHDPTVIIAAARAYRSHLQSPGWEAGGRSPPYQKHGATWLSYQCWEDELPPLPEAKNGNRNTIHDHCSIDELVERAGLVEGDLDAGSGGDSSIIDANWRIIN